MLKERSRRSGLSAFAAIALLFGATTQLSAAGFFQSIDDLPMPPGMTEIAAESVAFDSPAGRIVTAVGRIAGKPDAVRAFYRTALPPLGWEPVSTDTYRREGEKLTLTIEAAEGGLKVRVRVVPAAGNNNR